MEKELAERIAMALEGIEAELKRNADIAADGLAFNRELVTEQRELRRRAEDAQRELMARAGMGVPTSGIVRG